MTRTVVAAADVGANSVHLLVAAVESGLLEPLDNESVLMGLGDVVDERGLVPGPVRAQLVATLAGYAALARRLDAAEIVFLGTEPMRQAANAAAVVGEVEIAATASLHILDRGEEARLTLLGASGGRPLDRELLVVDIGGGSSQLVFAGPGTPVRTFGLPVGSARLTRRFDLADPPTPGQLAALRAEAASAVAACPEAEPAEIVAVGGTASNLVKVIPAAAADGILTAVRLSEAWAELASAPAEELAARHAIRPTRARILPAGAAILEAILARYGLAEATVREGGIREGAVRALAIAGRAWRDRLDRLVHGVVAG